jgi:asparagine synthase (glutamine-hydrolysing)
MCGICGIATPTSLGWDPGESRLVTMRDALVHRGPDGAGLHLGPGIALGHRRLSIVDVSHGAQPMRTPDGRHTIVYNGEVYNHPALMAELQAQGVAYATRCDTETVLTAFAREGAASVARLRGMFAIAIWDAANRTLWLARDRFGVKPLYYALLPDGRLVFGSEIKSILASGLVVPRLNLRALPDFLANHAPSGQETLFDGILRLPAGHTLTWHDGQVRIERYWDLDLTQPKLTGSPEDLVAEYRERLEEAVRLRLMADVPLGVFLSGGIDSAAITALMARMVDGPVQSFSVAFAEREANEFHYARLVARHCRTDHHEVLLGQAEFAAALPRLVWHEDEPIAHPSSVPLHFVSRLAAERVKVVLTGEGSDETLAGYNRYRATVLQLAAGRAWERGIPAPLRRGVRHLVAALPPAGAAGRRLQRTFLALPADLRSLYFDNFAVFAPSRQATLLAPATRESVRGVDPYEAMLAAFDRYPDAGLLDRLLYADSKTYLHELLMKQDQMSMAASIESRVPFLDHPLVEWATRLPGALKLRGLTTKVVLREAMRPLLPPEILSRRKMGFPVPVGAWFRGPMRGLLQDLLLHPRAVGRGLFDEAVVRQLVSSHVAGVARHDERLWLLLNLELWHRIFVDGEPVESVAPPSLARAA